MMMRISSANATATATNTQNESPAGVFINIAAVTAAETAAGNFCHQRARRVASGGTERKSCDCVWPNV